MFEQSVILAAGRGERMRPLTDYVPKALVRKNGIPLISHVVESLKKANKDIGIHVTVGYLSSLLYSILDSESSVASLIKTSGKPNSWFLQSSIVKTINEPIVICPCDIIFDVDWESIYKDFIHSGKPAAIVGMHSNDYFPEADGVKVLNNSCVDISRQIATNNYASGIQIINPAAVNLILGEHPVKSFYDIWRILIKNNSLGYISGDFSKWQAHDTLWTIA